MRAEAATAVAAAPGDTAGDLSPQGGEPAAALELPAGPSIAVLPFHDRSADRLRVTARLTDTRRKVQMWSGNYDSELTSATALFELQDEIREQIVATLGEFHGVIYSEETRRDVHRPTES